MLGVKKNTLCCKTVTMCMCYAGLCVCSNLHRLDQKMYTFCVSRRYLCYSLYCKWVFVKNVTYCAYSVKGVFEGSLTDYS